MTQARRNLAMNATRELLLPQRSEPPIRAKVMVDFHVGTLSNESLRTDLHGGAAKVRLCSCRVLHVVAAADARDTTKNPCGTPG